MSDRNGLRKHKRMAKKAKDRNAELGRRKLAAERATKRAERQSSKNRSQNSTGGAR